MRLAVISPHLDDAAYSVGQILAGQGDATIFTALAGVPVDDGHLTPYDKMCGFTTSAQAVRVRLDENERACKVLEVGHVEGGWFDGQYDQPFSAFDVDRWLTERLAGFDAALIPVGIGHPDHQRIAHVALASTIGIRTGVYLECPWYVRHPRDSIHALDQLAARWPIIPADMPVGDRAVKAAAVECYTSQLGPDMRAHVYAPEHVWWLDR